MHRPKKRGFPLFFSLLSILCCIVYRIVVCCLSFYVCAILIVVPHVLGIDVERNVVVLVLLGEGEALEDIHTVCDGDGNEDAEEDGGGVGLTVTTEEALHDALVVKLTLMQVGAEHVGRAVVKGDVEEVKGHLVLVDPNDAEESLVRQQLEVLADVVAGGLTVKEFAVTDMHRGGSEACGARTLFGALIEREAETAVGALTAGNVAHLLATVVLLTLHVLQPAGLGAVLEAVEAAVAILRARIAAMLGIVAPVDTLEELEVGAAHLAVEVMGSGGLRGLRGLHG